MIELMIVVAIIAIVLTLAAPSFRDSMARNRVEGLAAELSTDLQYARSEAVARNLEVGVFVETTCYTIYVVGSTDASGCADAQLGTGATRIKSVTNTSGSATSFTLQNNTAAFIRFEPVRGMAASSGGSPHSGEIVIGTTVGNWQLRADVDLFGRVKLCSPSGGFKGYPSC